MKKWLVIAVIGVAAAGALVLSRRCSEETQRSTMSDKMRACMDRMPEDFPPRVMFENAQEARNNTERILEILEVPDGVREADLLEEVDA